MFIYWVADVEKLLLCSRVCASALLTHLFWLRLRRSLAFACDALNSDCFPLVHAETLRYRFHRSFDKCYYQFTRLLLLFLSCKCLS